MLSNKGLIVTTGALVACVVAALTGCGDKPVGSAADTYGLKAVSLNSTVLFNGDITKIPGYDTRFESRSATGKAAAGQALITFDKAYAMVSQPFHGDYTMCEYWTDRYDAFKDADSTDLNTWETVLAGCRRSAFYEIVSVSELEKNGSYVEGTVYVKPGLSIVAVYFVNSRGEIIWTNQNTYINLDGLENSDNEELQHYLDSFESGWEYPWTNDDAREFLQAYSYYIPGGGYYYQVPNLGYWQNEIGIPASFVTEQCTNHPPTVGLSSPMDGATNLDTLSIYFFWYGSDIDNDMLTYTLYCEENPVPTTILYSGPNTSFTATALINDATYYWRVRVSDGENTVFSPTYYFTTLP